MSLTPMLTAELRLKAQSLDTEAVTAAVGIKPTTVWRTGDTVQGTKILRRTNAWVLAIAPRDGLDVAGPITELLSVVAPAAPAIRRLALESGVEVEISCAIRIAEVAPSITLSADILRTMHDLEATLDIDLILTA